MPETPTEPGYYWVLNDRAMPNGEHPFIIYLDEDGYCYEYGDDFGYHPETYQFLEDGPIEFVERE